jgi:cytochrome c
MAVNPMENTDEILADGKALYGMFCKHCHGKTGTGDGTMTHVIYSAVPHFNDDKTIRRSGTPMRELTSGHIFHAITYGLNAMGPHASQITEEERWKIVLYVQEELQHYGLE